MSIFAPTPEVIAGLRAYLAQNPISSSAISKTSSSPTAIVFDPKTHSHLLSSFVDIHIACVLHDNLVATFLPPFDAQKRETLTKWWQARFDEAERDERVIIIAMGSASDADDLPISNGGGEQQYMSAAIAPGKGTTEGLGQALVGYVSLAKPVSETGPFRGPVEKLLVNPRFRKRGVARSLMEKVEVVAREVGRTLLVS